MARRRSKAECQRVHALRRLHQRVDFEGYGPDVITEVKRQIAQGVSVCVMQESRRLRHHVVAVEGKPVVVVYDGLRHEVVTFLPQAAMAGYGLSADQKHRISLLTGAPRAG